MIETLLRMSIGLGGGVLRLVAAIATLATFTYLALALARAIRGPLPPRTVRNSNVIAVQGFLFLAFAMLAYGAHKLRLHGWEGDGRSVYAFYTLMALVLCGAVYSAILCIWKIEITESGLIDHRLFRRRIVHWDEITSWSTKKSGLVIVFELRNGDTFEIVIMVAEGTEALLNSLEARGLSPEPTQTA
jgi:hypothetical protein